MSHIHKDQLTRDGEWRKHLRPYGKRSFWKKERMAAREHSLDELTALSEELGLYDEQPLKYKKIKKRFGLKKISEGILGRIWTYTQWYASERQRDDAIRGLETKTHFFKERYEKVNR